MAFVDMQGFKIKSNVFIVKEIAVLTKNTSFHDVIKSPFSYKNLSVKDKKQTNWLMRNYHGINWCAGSITLEKLRDILRQILKDEKNIYVKGEEKIKWLLSILDCKKISLNIINIENIGCKMRLNKNKQKKLRADLCEKHADHFHCALKNVLELSEWYLKTNSKTPI